MAKSLVRIKNKGFGALEKNLTAKFGSNVMLPTKESVRLSAGDIAFVAQEMAPHYTGSLEEAIVARNTNTNDKYLAKSSVVIKEGVINPIWNKPVTEYAEEAHSIIKPKGLFELGPRSVEKQERSLYEVGGGFFSRALERMKSQAIADIVRTIKRGLATF